MSSFKGKKEKLPTRAFASLPVIRCVCGKEILMMPDVKVMGEAIENHVEWHRRKLKNKVEAELEANRIRDLLISQVLEKAGA